MIDLYNQGGPVYMGIITLLALIVIALSLNLVLRIKDDANTEGLLKKLWLIKESGLLAFIVGVFSMSLGLYSAFGAIELAGSISTSLLVAGLRLALIPVLYGFIIFILSRLAAMGLIWKMNKSD